MQTGDLSYWSRRRERLRSGKPICENNMTPSDGGAEAHFGTAAHILSPRAWALFPPFFFFMPFCCTGRDSDSQWRRTGAGGTSKANLISYKEADQTCSIPVKENIIPKEWQNPSEVGGNDVPILASVAIALIWFQGLLREIENKCAALMRHPT